MSHVADALRRAGRGLPGPTPTHFRDVPWRFDPEATVTSHRTATPSSFTVSVGGPRPQFEDVIDALLRQPDGMPLRCVGFAPVDEGGPSVPLAAMVAPMLTDRTSGAVGIVDAEAAGSAEIAGILGNMRREFDYVLLDLQPLTARPLGALAPLLDAVVIGISADRTRREVGRAAVERLQTAGIRVLGAVLTDRQYPIPDAIYRRL